MPIVYILYSNKLNKYYIGFSTLTLEERMKNHIEKYYENKFTDKADDWILFLEISCENNKQALAIENHIKKMKSKTYIENLKKYSEMIPKLLIKYAPDSLS